MSKTVMVFSHPNHEMALWASIRDLRPTVVFLTDGGGEDRTGQSRRGLSDLVDAGLVHFLAHPEQALYQALLQSDIAFFRHLAGQVAALTDGDDPDAVYCDSVEFYNPVHDISLPVVRAAFHRRPTPIFEVPLVYQTSMPGERYELLRAPDTLAAGAVWRDLTAGEKRAKAHHFASHYSILIDQLGANAVKHALSQSGREQVIPARASLPEPATGQKLRYEWRGALLKQRGEIHDIIGFHRHYVPIYQGLVP